MSELSDEFQGMKAMTVPLVHNEKGLEPVLHDGPHCFACGLAPEKCRCAWEAYR
jgi:hypothetical protein